MSPVITIGRLVVVAGVVLVAVGLLLVLVERSGGRTLRGDIIVQRPGIAIYLPIAASILASLVLTGLLLLIGLLRR